MGLARALDANPPGRLGIEVVLQGAGDGAMLGLRRHLRDHRHELDAGTVIVLGLAASGAGDPRWWRSDGPLIALRFLPRLAQLAEQVSRAIPEAGGTPHRGRGTSPAYPARLRSLPALTIGALDEVCLAPHSHRPADSAEKVDRATTDRMLQLALTLVDAIDADLPPRPAPPEPSAPADHEAASA